MDLFKEQVIEITGPVEKYRDRYQIKLKSPDQIRIVPAEPEDASGAETEKPDPKPADSKEEKNDKEETKDGKPVDPKRFFDC